MRCLLIGILSLMAFSGPSFGENERREMIRALRDAGKPGTGHEILNRLTGKWKVRGFMRIDLKSNPEMVSGVAKIDWILGKRFIKQDFDCRKLDLPIQGLGLIGYDKLRKEYTGIWCDNSNTGIANLAGKLSSGGTKIEFRLSQTDLRSGQRRNARAEIVLDEKKGFRYSVFADLDGAKEVEVLRLSYQ